MVFARGWIPQKLSCSYDITLCEHICTKSGIPRESYFIFPLPAWENFYMYRIEMQLQVFLFSLPPLGNLSFCFFCFFSPCLYIFFFFVHPSPPSSKQFCTNSSKISLLHCPVHSVSVPYISSLCPIADTIWVTWFGFTEANIYSQREKLPAQIAVVFFLGCLGKSHWVIFLYYFGST